MDMSNDSSDSAHANHAHSLNVEVFSPREPDPRAFSFPVNLTVAAAAKEAAKQFGYPDNSTPTFKKGTAVLDRNKTLAAAGVRDGDKLEIVDVGGGV
jgi:hypothetical protein